MRQIKQCLHVYREVGNKKQKKQTNKHKAIKLQYKYKPIKSAIVSTSAIDCRKDSSLKRH